jgi:hypothetical protein
MKKLIILILLPILAGSVAFCLMRSHKIAASKGGPLLDALPELTWVKTDLKLNDEQFSKVTALHVAYRPKCVELCKAISDAHKKLAELTRRDGQFTPELEAAIREHAEVHAECQRAMLKHLYETAATLDDEQARRYLETMLPFALDFTQTEPECHSH